MIGRRSRRASGIAVAAMAALLAVAAPARAATYDDPAPYCAAVGTIDKPDARYTGPAVPEWIARALMRATDAPADSSPAFFEHAAWRCDHGRVLACSYGANIPCDSKADTSRVPGLGAKEFCRENPGADVVPAVATGHATVFAWRCKGKRPVIARQVLKVDRRGFPSAFWHVVTPPRGTTDSVQPIPPLR
ncbi:MAG: hypothetical protein J0H14_02535 [Alphaproteobacteria bacterium]|nr:hypothetical protein [Alphaproteobacteria bacterium]